MKSKISIKNIFYYLQGNLRYKLYYNGFKCLIKTHILEQIDLRISLMDKECYYSGSCKMCGCGTTELQMCDKACEGECYLPMMSKREWKWFKIMVVDFDKDNFGLNYVSRAIKLLFEKKDDFNLFFTNKTINIVTVLDKICLTLRSNIKK